MSRTETLGDALMWDGTYIPAAIIKAKGDTFRPAGDTFAARLRQSLQFHGYNDTEFAAVAEIEYSQFNRYMARSRLPAMAVLQRILKHLPHVDARALIVGAK